MKPIFHSTLANELIHLQATGFIKNQDTVYNLLRVTAGGVLPEGAGVDSIKEMANEGISMVTTKMGDYSPDVGGGFVNSIEGGFDTQGILAPGDIYLQQPKPKGNFKFGRKSLAELEGVHPDLIKFANFTLKHSTQDFMVFDGLRTESEQRAYVKNGTSKTMQSMHLKQPDGFGHAVDLVPVVGTLPKWDWNLIYPVVDAAIVAAMELGIAEKIAWGGCWDRRLSDLTNRHDIKQIIQEYADRHPGKDFIDGPHFELRT